MWLSAGHIQKGEQSPAILPRQHSSASLALTSRLPDDASAPGPCFLKLAARKESMTPPRRDRKESAQTGVEPDSPKMQPAPNSLAAGIQDPGALRQVLLLKPLIQWPPEHAELGCHICDEGVSHLKTQINYSFPTNEQPLGSCKHHKHPQGSVNPINDTVQPSRRGTPPSPHGESDLPTLSILHPQIMKSAQHQMENHSPAQPGLAWETWGFCAEHICWKHWVPGSHLSTTGSQMLPFRI